MQLFDKPRGNAAASAVGNASDDLAIITRLSAPAPSHEAEPQIDQDGTANGLSDGRADEQPDGQSSESVRVAAEPVIAVTRDLRDYAQLDPVVRATPRWLPRYTFAVVCADLFAALIAGVIAISAFPSGVNTWVLTLFPPAWVAALAMGRTYEFRFVGNGSEEYRRLFHTSVAFLAVVGTLAYAFTIELTRGVVVVGLPAAMVLSLVAHWTARQVLHAAPARALHATGGRRWARALGR